MKGWETQVKMFDGKQNLFSMMFEAHWCISDYLTLQDQFKLVPSAETIEPKMKKIRQTQSAENASLPDKCRVCFGARTYTLFDTPDALVVIKSSIFIINKYLVPP